jgi:hypothetical protein
MLGIPIDLLPEFPTQAQTVLLTECARFDTDIVAKIKRQLLDGKTVVITSGLLQALQGKGIEDIVELEVTNRVQTSRDFLIGWNSVYASSQPILVPRINYLTNDSWEEVSCLGGAAGTPLLLSAQYGGGTLVVLTIPDNFADLYHLPAEVLNRIKQVVANDLFVRLEAPSQVALFVYDNDTFIVESFRDEPVEARLVVEERFSQVQDVISGEVFMGEPVLNWFGQPTGRWAAPLSLKPHSLRVFRAG